MNGDGGADAEAAGEEQETKALYDPKIAKFE